MANIASSWAGCDIFDIGIAAGFFSVTKPNIQNALLAYLSGVEDEISPLDLGFRLNDILLSALDRNKPDFYRKPREAFKQLADRCSSEGEQS